MCLGRHAESLDGSGTLVAATTQPLTDNVLGIDEDDVGLMMWSVIGNRGIVHVVGDADVASYMSSGS